MNRNFAIAALACFLAFSFSLNIEVAYDGAPESTLYGFPFPWNARSPAASLVKEVFLLPALIDLVLLTVCAKSILRAGDRLGGIAPKLLNRVSILLGGVGLVFFTGTFVLNEVFFSLWPEYWPEKVLTIRLGFGA